MSALAVLPTRTDKDGSIDSMSEASQFQNVRETPIWQRAIDTLRQPASVGIVVSVVLHAIAIVSIPLSSLDLGEEEDDTLDVDIVELTTEDLNQFAPQVTQEFSFPSYEFDEDSLTGLPSLSGRPTFPPPPPADSTEDESSMSGSAWSYWDELPSNDTDPYSGTYDDGYTDSYNYTDGSSDWRQQYESFVDRYRSGTGTSSRQTTPSEPTPQELARQKKEGLSRGERSEDTENKGNTTDETPTGDGTPSGQGYAEGIDALRLYASWVQRLFAIAPDLEDRVEIWDRQNPQSQEILLPPQPAFQQLVEEIPSVLVGILVDEDGEPISVIDEELGNRNLALTELPPRRNPVLQLVLREFVLPQIEFPDRDRPKAYWFQVDFRIRESGGDTEDTDAKGGETPTPPLDSEPMRLALQQAQTLALPEEAGQRWLDYLSGFEAMPRLLEKPLAPTRIQIPYPQDVEPPAEPPRTVFAIALDSQGTLIEESVRPLLLTGNARLDERAVEVLRENALDIPLTGATTAYIFVVEFVPEGEMPPSTPPTQDEELPMKKIPPGER
ncbi:hypothetical protein POG22_08185 [Geitlerinema sp. CS-897]|nr:hypothetical protein [Geitlerinema sp. CS-897]